MRVAVVGCTHGELPKIYEALETIKNEQGKTIDLLLCCGDFEAVRNLYDLSCKACPQKYLSMQHFYKYYNGERKAPVLTIFIGGNHEASNHMQELSYGGWVCPNIFYLGNAGVVEFGGLRIAGISGIYKRRDYLKGHSEVPPYSETSKRSAYHIRQLEVFRLLQITRPIDVIMSHDWPKGIRAFGATETLSTLFPKEKPVDFQSQIDKSESFMNPHTWDILKKLQPKYWFAGHMHVKFSAIVPHDQGATKFLALDKPVTGREFLDVLDIPHDANKPLQLSFDPEWLGILRDTDRLWNFGPTGHVLHKADGESFGQTNEKMEAVKRDLGESLLIDPGVFVRTAPVHASIDGDGAFDDVKDSMMKRGCALPPAKSYVNPQTTALCNKLGLTDPLVALLNRSRKGHF